MNQLRSGRAVVIGAGVIGAGVALELARAGFETTVVERNNAPGLGSTAASSAVIRFNYSTYAGTALAYESMRHWRDWKGYCALADDAMLTRFVDCGMVLLDSGDGGVVEATLGATAAVGVAHEVWDGAELAERLPLLDARSFWPPARVNDPQLYADADGLVGCAVWTPEAGYVSDPQLAAQNLADAAVAAGCTFRFNSTIVEIERGEDRVGALVLADGARLAPDIVVNVAGPHSSHINRLAGVADEMAVSTRPLRQQVDIALAPGDARDDVAGLPVVGDLDLGTYFRPEHDGILVGGVEAECDPMIWLDDPDEVDLSLHGDEWETKTLRVARRVPRMGIPHDRRGVVGVYDVSDDWVPILDRTDLAGFYVACGTSGNQFKNAPGIGLCMTELITAVESGHDHDRDPVVVSGRYTDLEIDLSTFSRNRDLTASTGTVLG